jgi:hypothetical protein
MAKPSGDHTPLGGFVLQSAMKNGKKTKLARKARGGIEAAYARAAISRAQEAAEKGREAPADGRQSWGRETQPPAELRADVALGSNLDRLR